MNNSSTPETPLTLSNSTSSVYSFVAWIASIFVYICFLAWALLPKKILYALGITYYPSRYYAIALPAYAIILYLLSGLAYIGLNLVNTLDPDDLATIRDKKANSVRQAPLSYMKCGVKEGIPDFGDIDPVQISSVLRQQR
jgi:hypothetical protein